MNVAPKRAEKAAVVLKADPELAAKVHAGEVKLAQAMRHVKQEHEHTVARGSGRLTGCTTSSSSTPRGSTTDNQPIPGCAVRWTTPR